MTEAGIRRLLVQQGVSVEPGEKLTGLLGGPDLECCVNGSRFVVEATDAAFNAEKLDANCIVHVIDKIQCKFREKASQLGGLDVPALVAIGTWDEFPPMKLLAYVTKRFPTGKTKLVTPIDSNRDECVDSSYEVTELRGAVFVDTTLQFARRSISGVLFCSVETDPVRSYGVLHPAAIRPFDAALLPNIKFDCVSSEMITTCRSTLI